MKVIVSNKGHWSVNKLAYNFWSSDKGLVRLVEKRADYAILLHYLSAHLLLNEEGVEEKCGITEELYNALEIKEVTNSPYYKIVREDDGEKLEIFNKFEWVKVRNEEEV